MKPRFLILLLVTVIAGWLRFTATSFGLPDKFRPDEQYLTGAAFGFDPTWNPHFAIYPAGQMYMDRLIFLLYGRLEKNSPEFSDFLTGDGGAGGYLVGRRISAAFGTATIPMIYFAAAPLGTEAALVASTLLAASTLHMRESKYWTTDAGAIFWLTFCFAMVIRIVYRGRVSDYLAAGLLAGIATATKYPVAMAVVAIAVGHVEGRVRRGRSIVASLWDFRIYLAAVASAVAFTCVTPYFFLDWNQTVHDYIYQRGFVLDGLPNPLSSFGWKWLLVRAMPESFGITMLSLFAVAILWMAIRRPPGALALLTYVVATCTVMTRSHYVFYRYLLVPLPALVLLSGATLADLASIATSRLNLRSAQTILACAVVLLILPSLRRDLQLNHLLLQDDSRTVARAWIERNIPRGSSIATTDLDNFCGKPQISGYGWAPLEPLDALPSRGVHWVLSDNFPPIEFYSKGPTEIEAQELNSKARLAFEVNPIKPGRPMPVFDPADAYYAPIANISSMTRPGPIIRIWELP